MKTFTDTANRVWTVAINVAAVKRCRALVEVDLYGLVDRGFEPLAALLGDPVKLVDTLYVLCKAEADARGVTDVQFGEALAGDALEAASTAFLAELVDFFPDPRVREGLRKILDAGRKVTATAIERMMATMATLDIEAEAAKLIGRSGTVPASSGSTQGRSRSAS